MKVVIERNKKAFVTCEGFSGDVLAHFMGKQKMLRPGDIVRMDEVPYKVIEDKSFGKACPYEWKKGHSLGRKGEYVGEKHGRYFVKLVRFEEEEKK